MSDFILTGSAIADYRALVLLSALRLEVKGLKISRGSSAYSIVKREYSLKGSKVNVLKQLEIILAK